MAGDDEGGETMEGDAADIGDDDLNDM